MSDEYKEMLTGIARFVNNRSAELRSQMTGLVSMEGSDVRQEIGKLRAELTANAQERANGLDYLGQSRLKQALAPILQKLLEHGERLEELAAELTVLARQVSQPAQVVTVTQPRRPRSLTITHSDGSESVITEDGEGR